MKLFGSRSTFFNSRQQPARSPIVEIPDEFFSQATQAVSGMPIEGGLAYAAALQRMIEGKALPDMSPTTTHTPGAKGG